VGRFALPVGWKRGLLLEKNTAGSITKSRHPTKPMGGGVDPIFGTKKKKGADGVNE